MEALKVENIRKTFRGDLSVKAREVLHGLSFHASEGEILGFLGPNGAGKTTTIKIILGLVRPDSGEVSIFGRKAGDRDALSRLGYLPENPYFYPHLTLMEFLVYCGRMSGLDRRKLDGRVGEVIDLVGLEDNGSRRLKNFSKGMLQRAGLAQAILHDPDLLILDEPFSGLDPMGRKMVRDILLDLGKKGKTIFFSSHILPDMEALCSRACIIREGTVVRSIGIDEIFRLGEGTIEVTARGCGSVDIDAISTYVGNVETNGEELFLSIRRQEFVRTVVQHLYNCGGEVLEVTNRHRSLEDIFVDEVSREPAEAGPGRIAAAPAAEDAGTSGTNERVEIGNE